VKNKLQFDPHSTTYPYYIIVEDVEPGMWVKRWGQFQHVKSVSKQRGRTRLDFVGFTSQHYTKGTGLFVKLDINNEI